MSILPLFLLGSVLVFIGIFVLTSGSSGMSSVLMMTGCTYGEEEERREKARRRGRGECRDEGGFGVWTERDQREWCKEKMKKLGEIGKEGG